MLSTTYNNEEKLWNGNEVLPLYNPDISLAQALFNSMTIFGSKIAQISDNNGIRMTFDEIKVESIQIAQNLQALGYKQEQVFTLVARNSQHVAPITFASIAIGCPVNPLDPSLGRYEYLHMFKITKPVLVFCDIDCYGMIDECLAELGNKARIFTIGGRCGRSEPVEDLLQKTTEEGLFIPVKVDGPNEAALIVCTSGTTGEPKGVCLTHAILLENQSKQCDLSQSNDIMLSFSSLYWSSGIAVLLRGTLIGATRIITTDGFAPDRMLRLIEQYKVTYCMNATHQIILLMKHNRLNKTDLSSIKYLMVIGSKVPYHVKIQISRCLPNGNIAIGYGMSEICGAITYDCPIKADKDVVGQLLDGICMKIIDDFGSRCGVNEKGEICIKTYYPFHGYYDNQTATEEARDIEGFLTTGDIGYFDEDGDLHFVGRKKELLKYYNYQIAPAEIDAFLTESKHIESVCVVGIPDEVAPDLPAAVIVRAHGSGISEQDVFDLVAGKYESIDGHFSDHYKLRGGVYFVDSLPTTASGKMLRRHVKEVAIALHKERQCQMQFENVK